MEEEDDETLTPLMVTRHFDSEDVYNDTPDATVKRVQNRPVLPLEYTGVVNTPSPPHRQEPLSKKASVSANFPTVIVTDGTGGINGNKVASSISLQRFVFVLDVNVVTRMAVQCSLPLSSTIIFQAKR